MTHELGTVLTEVFVKVDSCGRTRRLSVLQHLWLLSTLSLQDMLRGICSPLAVNTVWNLRSYTVPSVKTLCELVPDDVCNPQSQKSSLCRFEADTCTMTASLCPLDEEPEEELTVEQLIEKAEGGDARAQTRVSKALRQTCTWHCCQALAFDSVWLGTCVYFWLAGRWSHTFNTIHQNILTRTNHSKRLCNVLQHWHWFWNILSGNLRRYLKSSHFNLKPWIKKQMKRETERVKIELKHAWNELSPVVCHDSEHAKPKNNHRGWVLKHVCMSHLQDDFHIKNMLFSFNLGKPLQSAPQSELLLPKVN